MLAAIIVYGLRQGTFDLVAIGPSSSTWIFLGFVIAFAIKAPLFPFRVLPDAYRESPPEVSAVLSGVVSKAGRVRLHRNRDREVFPADARPPHADPVLAASGSSTASLLAFRAPDVRGVVATRASPSWA